MCASRSFRCRAAKSPPCSTIMLHLQLQSLLVVASWQTSTCRLAPLFVLPCGAADCRLQPRPACLLTSGGCCRHCQVVRLRAGRSDQVRQGHGGLHREWGPRHLEAEGAAGEGTPACVRSSQGETCIAQVHSLAALQIASFRTSSGSAHMKLQILQQHPTRCHVLDGLDSLGVLPTWQLAGGVLPMQVFWDFKFHSSPATR